MLCPHDDDDDDVSHSNRTMISTASTDSDDESSDRNVEDLINDETESSASFNEGDSALSLKTKVRKRKRGSDKRKTIDKMKENEYLEDDDYDLLAENLGISVLNRRKYRRVRVGSSGDEGENDIEKELFPDDDNVIPHPENKASLEMDLEIHSSSEPEDVDDFIVDDEGQPIRKNRYALFMLYSDFFVNKVPNAYIS